MTSSSEERLRRALGIRLGDDLEEVALVARDHDARMAKIEADLPEMVEIAALTVADKGLGSRVLSRFTLSTCFAAAAVTVAGIVALAYLQGDIRLDVETRYEARVSAMAKQIDDRVNLLVTQRTADLMKDFAIYGGVFGKVVEAERKNPALINWAISPTGLSYFEESKRARDKQEIAAAIVARQADLKREQDSQTAMLNEISVRLAATQSQNAQMQQYRDGLRRQSTPTSPTSGARR